MAAKKKATKEKEPEIDKNAKDTAFQKMINAAKRDRTRLVMSNEIVKK